MRVFVFTFSREYNRDLAIELIPLGIEPVEIESKAELLESAAKFPDIRNLITEYPDIDLVYQLKNIQSDIRITLILHTQTQPDEVIRLSKTGVRHLLNFHENPSDMAEEILGTLIEEQGRSREKRLHYRVQPMPSEKLVGTIFGKDQKNFTRGNLLDISAGGFAIRLPENPEPLNLSVGHTYDPVFLSIPGSQVKTLSTLVAKRQNIAGFRFDNVEPQSMKRIAEYIYVNMCLKTNAAENPARTSAEPMK
jgi:hypothetical protein